MKSAVPVFDRMDAQADGRSMTFSRQQTLTFAASLAASACALAGCGAPGTAGASNKPAVPASTPTSVSTSVHTDATFASLEAHFGAHLGVYAINTGTGRTVSYRAGQRSAFDSTYKALAVGALLKRDSDAQLATVIHYSTADLQSYAPITRQHVATGMTLEAIMVAAVEYSDNTAANLLLAQLGGPSGLQAALRQLGDGVTDVDRTEPEVNTATPGDSRDTTTPQAIATDLRGYALGDVLTGTRRQLLDGWLDANTTGGPYIRAGVPSGWVVGDKTGNGGYGTRNDIAIVRPPSGAPIVLTILTSRGTANAASDDSLIADATREALAALG